VSVVGNQKHQLNSGLKRKAPLMLGAATNGSPPVKLARDRPAEKLYQVQSVWFHAVFLCISVDLHLLFVAFCIAFL